MADIVAFPSAVTEQDDTSTVWTCRCGCMSFWARADGELQCCQCDGVVSGADFGAWRKHLPAVPAEPGQTSDDNVIVTDLNSSPAALQRVLGKAGPSTVAVIVLQEDGTLTAWGGVDAGDQEKWLKRMLRRARKMLMRQA